MKKPRHILPNTCIGKSYMHRLVFFFVAVLQGYALEVESRDGKHSRDTPSSFSGHMGAGLGPRHYTVHLRAVLLLQFMEHLDKLMYNAYEGSCVTLSPVPKVPTFPEPLT